ncbi:hypothetical protein O181_044544 [Austropuccinia psidii MF-1]|uniref:Uncharacterized protein n=1 Tax=Austropuccinia psidii MF-1 TaxID=1389203 RepID=A0A9Q3DK82_9BASI|nr:hypothetical protein [Austropuccinia psidii MF-1]
MRDIPSSNLKCAHLHSTGSHFRPWLASLAGSITHSQFADSASLSNVNPPLIVSGLLPTTHSFPPPTLTRILFHLFCSSPSFQATPTQSATLTTVINRFKKSHVVPIIKPFYF